MANLSAHAQAAEIMGQAFIVRAAECPNLETALILSEIGAAYADGAARMIAANIAEAQASDGRCTFDHSKMTGPCPACKARA